MGALIFLKGRGEKLKISERFEKLRKNKKFDCDMKSFGGYFIKSATSTKK